ncbi:hypothetical protein EV196_11153 [Mariniflexile fucanivorans]|uniref:Uncharacterized protein n=1 Tax=Mariniflexile fucanivorans TaxID=264023 RepID=A0A4V6NGT2_9FLAO|nr:hypothetical protein [Mariniflexile fucanivorans]TCL62857.1 hypothetical protein EV196_11153 [Mariniflexile fucanivorans]
MKPNIELNIDQLVLEGFSRNEAYAITQSLQAELHQLIENGRLENTLTQEYHQQKMTLNPISTLANTRPEGVGRQIAQSIFSSLIQNGNTNL